MDTELTPEFTIHNNIEVCSECCGDCVSFEVKHSFCALRRIHVESNYKGCILKEVLVKEELLVECL